MIEPEHILDSTEDTGYRLCATGKAYSDSPEDNKIFAAHWDPNDLNRLFVCSQSGKLRVLDTRHECSMTYNIFFRRYVDILAHPNEPVKLIERHWDKMVIFRDYYLL